MGKLYNWLFGEQERAEEPEVEPPVDDVLLRALLNSETITREKAMTLPAVSGAVDFISSCVACMPVKLYKVKQGKVEEVSDDVRVAFLNGDTQDTLDAYQMKKAMVEDYLLGKGGYCYIRRDRNDVTGLFYVADRYITIWKSYEPIYKDYQIYVCGYDNDGKEKQSGTFKPWDFIKLLRNTKDGASGTGLVVEISKELETAYQTLLYQLGLVKNGGAKRGFLKAQRKLGQEEINTLKKAWAKLYTNGSENIVVLNNGLEFQEASASSVEMQLNESKRTLQDEINNLFHISDDFYNTFKFAIYPIVKAFETALNRDLLLEKEKKNHFFEFDVKEIVKANLQERYNAYKTAKETGFMTLNEIRRAENMNYVDGLDVVNVGLGAVLYDINEHKFFTPNTGEATSLEDAESGNGNDIGGEDDADMQKMLEGHELVEEYDESGNSADRFMEERFNPNHSAANGQFISSGSGGGVASPLAQKALDSDWESFKASVNDKAMMKEMKDNGIKSMSALREYWVNQKMNDFTKDDAKEVPIQDAVDIVRENIPQNVLDGWFVNANSAYKERLETVILSNKAVRNAGLNIAYQNYKDAGNNISFNDFVNSDLTMYRGEHGQKTVKSDVFKSYTTDKKVAQGFGGDISEIKIKPIDTLGSYQTTGEQEYLVPIGKIGQ